MSLPDPKNRFNTDALTWDTKPDVLAATALAHQAYLARLPAPSTLATYDVLEIGSGTGLLSLALAPAVRSVTAVDAAAGMIAVLQSRLAAPAAPTNIRAVCALLTGPDDPRIGEDPVTGREAPARRVDLVVSNLVLHHVADLQALFGMINACLKPGGEVMVTDFEDFGPEARRFHPEARMDGVCWHGIKRGVAREVLEGPGLGMSLLRRGLRWTRWWRRCRGMGSRSTRWCFHF
ncbi:S-adenosyl-L-methionine-dependent methyltransferase [Lasiosphaeria hispida]|uniref:S-adenosyl-L-methionine-dependent methyltransferase n=1 Tax=Lasiosphaeria hispida TaxID=260671 RepID=A0AAJ0MDR7_9PEZI|nr:S-adenosyl-L-methionine-dependent methyltransferase [Lasiosphaeria hispida]